MIQIQQRDGSLGFGSWNDDWDVQWRKIRCCPRITLDHPHNPFDREHVCDECYNKTALAYRFPIRTLSGCLKQMQKPTSPNLPYSEWGTSMESPARAPWHDPPYQSIYSPHPVIHPEDIP
jgi:hypothetical protein